MYQIKQIKGFKDYEIDTNGNVFSYKCRSYRKLKPSKGNHGYLQVVLSDDGKRFTKRIHRLIADAFVSNVNGKPFVLHKDGNKLNNSISNLYWGTQKENIADAVRHGKFVSNSVKGERNNFAKLNEKQVRVIKWALHFKAFQTELARIFNVSSATISYIKNGKCWSHA